MSDHVLEVSPDGEGFTIECLAGNGCNGWLECGKEHKVGDLDAYEGPYDCDETAPWLVDDEWEDTDCYLALVGPAAEVSR